MTDNSKMEALRTMLGDERADFAMLSVYLELAAHEILNRMYPYREDHEGLTVPTKYEVLQLKLACYMINKRGAEGQIQHIENGIHRNYGDADIPDSMLKTITPFAQAIR